MKLYLRKTARWIALLLVTCLAFAFLVAYGFYISATLVLGVIAGEVYYLFRYMENNSRIMMQFIWSVRYSDFLASYTSGKKSREDISPELAEAMDEAILEYKKHLQEKESQLQYFQALANHIDLSVIVYTAEGKVEWMNYAAQFLTGITSPETIDGLSTFHPELPARLRAIRPGDISILQVSKGNEHFQLALSGMSFVVLGKPLTVVSLKNIRSVLEDKETEAWQKLIRVLTHEIMNSMAPILSLSELLRDKFNPPKQFSGEEAEEVNKAIETIFRRSNGLLRFVENYRKVTGIPSPVMQVVPVNELLNEMQQLLASDTPGLQVVFPSSYLQIIADKPQIEQVLINLVKNAREAQREGAPPLIELSAGIDANGYVFIQVADNGKGIPPAVLERIFIPFFTSKPSGSGIGLSISRQIMQMHKGSLTATSKEGSGSRFILTFRDSRA